MKSLKEVHDRMIEIVPADTGKFRNVVPKAIEDMLKEHQQKAWDVKIDEDEKAEIELRPERTSVPAQ